jgi:hypothetical protein
VEIIEENSEKDETLSHGESFIDLQRDIKLSQMNHKKNLKRGESQVLSESTPDLMEKRKHSQPNRQTQFRLIDMINNQLVDESSMGTDEVSHFH